MSAATKAASRAISRWAWPSGSAAPASRRPGTSGSTRTRSPWPGFPATLDDGLERPAVHRPRRTGDVGGARGAEEDDDPRDLVGRAHPPEGDPLARVGERLLPVDALALGHLVGHAARAGPQRRLNHPRCDRVDQHTAARVRIG